MQNDFQLELYINIVNQSIKELISFKGQNRIKKKCSRKKKILLPCCLIQESNEIDQFQIWGVKEKRVK